MSVPVVSSPSPSPVSWRPRATSSSLEQLVAVGVGAPRADPVPPLQRKSLKITIRKVVPRELALADHLQQILPANATRTLAVLSIVSAARVVRGNSPGAVCFCTCTCPSGSLTLLESALNRRKRLDFYSSRIKKPSNLMM